MELRKNTIKRNREIVRRNLAHERSVDREIERNIETYREQMTDRCRAVSKDERPRCIIAEGDSWFRYVVGFGLMYYLDQRKHNEVLNLAWPGDEVRDMVTERQLGRLARELRRGPTKGRKYDAFCFSGGGNDLLGQERFRLWLRPWEPGMTAREVIDTQRLKGIMSYLQDRFLDVIGVRDDHAPTTGIYLHDYDFAQPTGKGVCGKGPWLKPGLVDRKVPAALRADVVAEFLKIFRRMLKRVERNSDNVTLVETQGTLTTLQWANEIHPSNAGFKKLATRMAAVVEDDIPRGADCG